ncbi:hypothetical protein GUJ93_ZPchr0012g21838 [Zizania palustris]|uniref:Uncharacterized protein n=1 Tax=Zizania palustris TaxID=103762 RepID=A0A8J5WNU5_ZIZPA|nr:hypothetical protein GUJ93_ZPchr0012g21838 [Zizania palustris]
MEKTIVLRQLGESLRPMLKFLRKSMVKTMTGCTPQLMLQQEREDRKRELDERERDKEREREEREREKERDRDERQQEREAWKKETNYLVSALQALQFKLNVQFLPPQPAATDLQLPLVAPSGSANSDTTPTCIEAQACCLVVWQVFCPLSCYGVNVVAPGSVNGERRSECQMADDRGWGCPKS